MATMEPVNKNRKRGLKKRRNRTGSSHEASPGCGRLFPAEAAARPASMETRDSEGRSALLGAGLSTNLATDPFLAQSREPWLEDFDVQDNLPLHAVLSYQRSHNATAGLRYLLERGAAINITSDSGQTPLHVAAANDLLDCAKLLVDAGADVLARDHMGLTPLDLACSKQVARFLKHHMWHEEKKKEAEDRKQGEERPASSHRLTQDFGPRDIQNVPHRGRPQGKSTSPWTEVAVHLGVEEPSERSPQEEQNREESRFTSDTSSDPSHPGHEQ